MKQAAGVGSEIYTFQSLGEMVATSDAVVEGSIEAVESGRIVGGSPESGDAIQFQQATLSVDQVLYGAVPSTKLLLEELPEVDPTFRVGAYGMFFIHEKDAPSDKPYWRLTNTQGAFVEGPDSYLVASNEDWQWTRAIEDETLEQLEADVAASRQDIESGKVSPASPSF